MITVLFVCLGNICRSPMAEAVFQKMVDDAGLSTQIQVDSAGTGSWHVGEPAHHGTQKVLAQHNIPYNGRARQVASRDFVNDADYIIAMSQSNYNDLVKRFGTHPHLYRLLEFAKKVDERDVPDPYYTGNFDYVYGLVTNGCRGLFAEVTQGV